MSPATLVLCAALISQADETPAKVLVNFTPDRPEEAWIAEAFEQNAARDLAGPRVVLVDADSIDIRGCDRRDKNCLLDRYRASQIDLAIFGRLAGPTLDIEVYECWLKTRISRDTIRLDQRPTLIEIHNRTLRAVAPFFESGGLFDRKQWILRKDEEREAELRAEVVIGALVFSATFLTLPLLLGRALKVPLSKRTLRTALRASAALPLALIAAAFVKTVGGLEWVLPMVGGAAWSWFLLLNLRIALPAVSGLSNIRHGYVGRMLRAWIITSLMRLFLIVSFFGPLLLAAQRASVALGVSSRVAWMMLVPLFGLLLHFWFSAVVEQVSRRLDRELVIGSASVENPWHAVARKYFLGYVRRLGLELDRSILDRTLFLPGKGNEIVSYGGGLLPARIVVPEALLETALHPLANDAPIQDEDEEVRLIDLGDPTGLILPGATRARQESKSDDHVPPRRKPVRPLLGQNETLLGYVVPLPRDTSIPLVIDDPGEYAVLRELLTAHYAAFDTKLYGEEADDTDPTQKDFLFGALLREFGCVERQDTLLFSIPLGLGLWASKGPGWVRSIAKTAAAVHRRFFARYPAMIADGYAALNRGLHHLIQYLDHLRTGADAGLTARADEPTLTSTSNEILRRVAAETGSPHDHTRNRLVWLSQHLFAPIPEPGLVSMRMLFAILVVLGLGGVVASAVIESIEYAPKYQQRMAEMRQKIEDARREQRDQEDVQ